MPLQPPAEPNLSKPHSGPRKKIIVIGAGLAGLCAAYELDQAGIDITVLEARNRPGGRVMTLREGFADGLYAEGGAQYFYPLEPDYALPYIQRFGLETVPFLPKGLKISFSFYGQTIQKNWEEQADWPLDFTPNEKKLGLIGMRKLYLGEAFKDLLPSGKPELSPHLIGKYGQISFDDWMKQKGASPDAITFLRLHDWDLLGEKANNISMLELIRDRLLFSTLTKPFYGLKGGNDRLPLAFAKKIAKHVHYGAAATHVRQDENQSYVDYVQHGHPHTIKADNVICALPFSTLQHLKFSPSLPLRIQNMIKELPYASFTRVYIQTREKFWLQKGLSGLTITDGPMSYAWESTWDQDNRRGILQGWFAGDASRTIDKLPPSDRLTATMKALRPHYPEIDTATEWGTSLSWDQEEWSQGGVEWFRPGTLMAQTSEINHPEGRIHFAGSHTASFMLHGTMQGALESAQRVVQEVR